MILHADDSAFIIMTMKIMFQQLGCDSVEASSGEQTLQLARTQKPDIILLDAMMPGLDGYQTAAALRGDAATQNIPIIMLTGNAPPEHAGKTSGWVDDYLVKPVQFERLKAALGALIELPGGNE